MSAAGAAVAVGSGFVVVVSPAVSPGPVLCRQNGLNDPLFTQTRTPSTAPTTYLPVPLAF